MTTNYNYSNANTRSVKSPKSPLSYQTDSTDLRESELRVSSVGRMNSDLLAENERLSLKLSEKVRIIEELKAKYARLENSQSDVESLYSQNATLNVEISRLRDELARSRSSEASWSKLKAQVEVLLTEKNELHMMLNEKENLIVELRYQLESANGVRRKAESSEQVKIVIAEKDRTISELHLRLSKLEEQALSANEWKNKSLNLAAENQRLLRSLEDRAREIESLRVVRVSQPIEYVHKVDYSVQEKSRLEALLIEKTQECEALRLRLNEREKVTYSTTTFKSEYDEKYLSVSKENEKLSALIAAKQKEIEVLTVKVSEFHEIEAKLKALVEEKKKLVIERDSAMQERARVESRLIEKDHEYDMLKVKLRESEKPSYELVELKKKLAIITSENERLNVFIEEKKKEIAGLNKKGLEYHDLELKLKLAVEENNKLVVEKESAVQEKKRLEIVINEISEEYEALSLKFKETQKVYLELSELKAKLGVIMSENEKLSVLISEKEKEIRELNVTIVGYKKSVEEMKVSVEQSKKTIEENKRVIEDNRRVFIEKERDFESAKSYKSHQQVVRSIETDYTHTPVRSIPASPSVVVIKQESHVMSSEVSRLEREMSLRVNQIRQLEERVALLLIENKRLMQEREIIDTTFSCEVKELESLRLRSSELNILSMQLKMYESEKEETLKLIDQDRRLFERSLHEKELVIKELQAKSIAHEQRVAYFSEFKAKVNKLAADNERLVIELQDKSREIETLRSEIFQLNMKTSKKTVVQETHTSEIILNDKIREIGSLKMRIAELEKGAYLSDELSEKLRLSSAKYESIISTLNGRLTEMEALRVRCAQLADLESKLTLVTRERDEAVHMSRINSEEIGRYQEKVFRLEAQVTELVAYKNHQISSPKVIHVETQSYEKEAELNLYKQEIAKYQEKIVRLEAQVTQLNALNDKQFSATKVVHVENKSSESELNFYKQELAKYQEKIFKLEAQVTELSTYKHQTQLVSSPAKVITVEKNVERENELNKVISELKSKLEIANKEKEKLTAIVSEKETVKKSESSKAAQTLALVQSEKEEALREKNRLTVQCEEYLSEIEILRLRVKEIDMFSIEKQRLLEIISTKTREIEMLEERLTVYEKERNNLRQIAYEKEKVIEEMELKLFAQNSVSEVRRNHEVSFAHTETKRLKNSATEKSLKSKLSYLTGFNEQFESVVVERDHLESQVAEKQKNIQALQAKVSTIEKELASSGDLKGKVTMLDTESKRLNHVAMERLAKLNMSEQQLKESTKEKSLLGLEVSEKQVELSLLKTKIVELEKQAKLVVELQGKLAMMVLENERLTKDLNEKNQYIEILRSKYGTLENLYLHVRGNMKKPDPMDKKSQDVVGAIEQVEHKLGLYGKSKAMKKTLSVQSILNADPNQIYSLNVGMLTDSKVMPSTTKSVTTTEKVIFQKATY